MFIRDSASFIWIVYFLYAAMKLVAAITGTFDFPLNGTIAGVAFAALLYGRHGNLRAWL